MNKIRSNVFVTDANYKHTLGIVRSLGKRGLVIHCGSSSTSLPISSFSRYVKHALFYPDPMSFPELFKIFIKKSSKKYGYKVVIPVGYDATFVLSRFKNEIRALHIPVADFRSHIIAASKKKTILLAQKLNIPIPRTIIPSSLSELEDEMFSYPSIVKGVRESGFIKYADNLQDLKQKVNEIYSLQSEYPLVQEYIPGIGYGFFALFNRGMPRAIFMHKRVREYPVRGGASTCAESVFEPKLLNYGLNLLKTLNWHGVAMVEFRKDFRDGEFKLMEINPKFWGSLDLAIASGVDFPFLLYKMIVEGDTKPVFNYKVGVKFMWPFPDDLLRTIDRPSDFRSFFFDFFDQKVIKSIDLSDLAPNLMQFTETAYRFAQKLRRVK